MKINPIWFYLVGISTKLTIALTVIGILLLALAVVLAFCISAEVSESGEDAEKLEQQAKAALRRKGCVTAVIAVVLFILASLVPSASSIKSIVTASVMTEQNVKMSSDGEEMTPQEFIDYIFEKMGE